MLRKFTSALAIALFVGTPILAQERTFVTNPPTTSGTGVTYNSGTNTVTATAADGARLFSITRPIERGAKYTYEFTISGYSAGKVAPYVGTTRDTYVAPTVNVVNSPATDPLNSGLVPIADNFTTANGLDAASIPPLGGADPGAFRMFCGAGQLLSDDPLVVPNMPGAAHMHQFFGNTGANAYSTYKSLRTSGGSTCGTDQNNPINRSAYWFPAIMNGRGGIVQVANINLYYKRDAIARPECTPGDPAQRGICVRLPHGLGMIIGYNMTTMAPAHPGTVRWHCRTPNTQAFEHRGASALESAAGRQTWFTSLKEMMDKGGCPIGAVVGLNTDFPNCWDGTRVRTPNHRDHVSYVAAGNVCPVTHPYHFMDIALLIEWDVDANLATWRLSSDDQMGMGVDAGSTFHTDYMEAWSPQFATQFQDGCIDGDRTCAGGNDGTGTAIKGGNVAFANRSRIVPLSRQGLGRLRSANGTYRGEFTAPADGEFGLNFFLFTGNITGFKVTKITKGGRGPVTTTTTQ